MAWKLVVDVDYTLYTSVACQGRRVSHQWRHHVPVGVGHGEMRKHVDVGFLNEKEVERTGGVGVEQADHAFFRSVNFELQDPDRVSCVRAVCCINGRHGSLRFVLSPGSNLYFG